MTTIENKTSCPFDVETLDGMKVLPALGKLDAEFANTYLDKLRLSPAVKVHDAEEAVDPALEACRAMATEMGIKWRKNWGIEKLTAAMEKETQK